MLINIFDNYIYISTPSLGKTGLWTWESSQRNLKKIPGFWGPEPILER